MLVSKILKSLLFWPLLSSSLASGLNITQQQAINRNRTISVGYVIFDGFEGLDVWGPLEWITQMSVFFPMNLSTISYKTGPVHARYATHLGASYDQVVGGSMLATHTFSNAPDLDIIIVPGGTGVLNATLGNSTIIEDFLNARFDCAEYLLGVSFGVTHLARSGLLNGKKATTNKSGWTWITPYGKDVNWVTQARWVADGKIWTSSGMASSIDMMYEFLGQFYGKEGALNYMTNVIEYAPHTNPNWDPYGPVHNVPGANATSPTLDCVGPVPLPVRNSSASSSNQR
ncbi:hypothetical protein LEMA_P065720.1 [Plenodomus lingam JN3]|uniref:DJ-1/PfpI domain-containing protein n=2 Tax=Leptosphaeria maculans TaxID=5022 RepID=E4ZGM6_LEPMJ|nr:hypothetical protein LEMA_P065720.1 [Plenodomus lingam JN3]CBX90446.1 hypothetical protein LEMA_P065720.1 [Plenodomus lingam JN3]